MFFPGLERKMPEAQAGRRRKNAWKRWIPFILFLLLPCFPLLRILFGNGEEVQAFYHCIDCCLDVLFRGDPVWCALTFGIMLGVFWGQLFFLPVWMIWNSCEWWRDGKKILCAAGVFFAIAAPVMLIVMAWDG